MTELRVGGLHKSFGGQPILRGVDLVVPAGSLTAVLGPSGSGKTTLLRVIAGFERADRGEVSLAGAVVDDGEGRPTPPERRHIGYVPQEGSLFPHLNVEANVGFGLPRGRRRGGRVSELMKMVGLEGLAHRFPHELSGGQQQRVALARALAIDPHLVLLDEPFSSLDASLRAAVRADVRSVLRQAGATAVLVTHDQDEALSLADHVAVMREGQIGQLGTPEALYARPGDPELARFLGETNLIEGILQGATVSTPLGELELRPPGSSTVQGSRVQVLVRPEQIELTAADGARFTGVVVEYEYYGHDAVVRLRPDGDWGVEPLVVRVAGGPRWAVGSRAGVVTTGQVVAWAPGGSSAANRNVVPPAIR
ncbi:MAG: hypothetical protein JWM85_2818 [Acidimicrobiaceae bacterium]|nr:hypothetical protein [Acidimicrobiaceae bacterium]